jgi:dTDP-glucose pyrophosphorylase
MTGHLSNSRMFTNKNSNRQINSENLVPLIFLKAKRKKKVFLQPSITLPIQILIDSDVSPVTIVLNEKKTINRNCLKMQRILWASIDFQV